ncbi:serine/threonine protein phosphatase [Lentzea alba]
MALLANGEELGSGVGGGSVLVDVEGVPVFAKRVPLTRRELERPFSTENLFELPVVCQYGIGSPGFSAWRELAANQIVTEAVLAGEASGFPLLHHFRVLPGRAPVAELLADVDQAVARLGGSHQIRTRFTELAAAGHSLVLFFDHIPLAMTDWLEEDPAGRAAEVERQLAEIVAFLRSRELLHLDVHLGNMRTDGTQAYLVDFGLVTSPRFDLSDAEREFARQHVDHDEELAAMYLWHFLAKRPHADVDVLARLAPVAERTTAFYDRLLGRSGQ